MKRLFMLLSLIIAALVIVACEADNGTIYGLIYEERTHEERPYEDAHEKLYEELHYEDELHEAKYEYVEIEGIKRRIMPQGSLTVEHFLEDLAYMVYVLENNFALLDVARWAHGVDYRELAANAREAVVAMEELCEGIFMALVHFHFYPLMITGHFDIFTPTSYDWGISNFYGGYRGRKARMNLELMRSPLAYRFYGSPGARSGFYEGRRQVLGYEPTYNRIMGYFPGGMSEPLHTGVVTEIIEEGRIAYIFTGANMQVLRQQQSAIFNFYRQISDFEHLIIDVRGNLGGNADVFLNVIVRPTLTEAVEAPYVFQFFQDGPYVRRFGDMLFLSTTSSGYLTNLEEYRTAREVLSSNDLPEFNLADIERLDYGARSGRVSPLTHPSTMVSTEYAFSGKIWLLTDHTMMSAAQLAAWYSMELGFATRVGETTGGALGGPRTLAFMPNTGIIFYFDIFYITDSRGRPLEAGTIPHYFNREGMDALETVLAMIEEGAY